MSEAQRRFKAERAAKWLLPSFFNGAGAGAHEKPRPANRTGLVVSSVVPAQAGAAGAYSFCAFSRRAAPRMSPSEAPESEEPNCSMASFSSAISSALTDSETRRAALSTLAI
jgi:hypothetical protein